MRTPTLPLLAFAFAACADPAPSQPRTTNGSVAYDADNDGYADVAISQRPDGSSGGALVIHYGGDDGLDQARSTSLPISMEGSQAVWIGDINGDGYADAGVTTDVFGRPPSISIGYGGPRGSTGTTQVQCDGGEAPSSEGGAIIGRAGDLDGDGIDDLMATSRGGRVCVWRGRPERLTGAPELFEQAVANNAPTTQAMALWKGLGDVDGDGHADVALSGEIRLGGPGLLRDDGLLMPIFPAGGPADPNGDGIVDLVGAGPTVFECYLGRTTGFDSSISVRHTFNLASFTSVPVESEVVHLGDIDGDGTHDAAISVPYRDQGDVTTEGVFAMLYGGEDCYAGGAEGITTEPPTFPVSVEAIGLNGFRTGYVIGLGDIDGDGIGDLGIENQLGGLTWIRGSTRGIRTGEVDGSIIVNRSGPRMAATGAGAW